MSGRRSFRALRALLSRSSTVYAASCREARVSLAVL